MLPTIHLFRALLDRAPLRTNAGPQEGENWGGGMWEGRGRL